jgi:cellulose synthase operon protein C
MRTPFLGTLAAALCLGTLIRPGFAASYLQQAQNALRKGDLRTAQIELRNAVKSDPQDAQARFLLAEVQLQLGDPVAAEQQARAAAERGYDVSRTTPLIGQAMLMQNRAADLLRQFQPIGHDPKLDAEIMVDRGAAQLTLGQPDDARKSFGDAQKLDPTAIQPWIAGARLALVQHDIPAAQAQIDKALVLDSKSLDARLLKAELLAQGKDIAGAVTLLSQAINDTPPALPARVMRANLMIAKGKFQEAKTDDDAVLALQPQNVEALYLKAVLLHEAKNDQGANDILQRLQPLFDRMPRAYYLQAAVQEGLGLTRLAESSARDYVARAPHDPSGVMLLAQLENAIGRPDQAVPPLQRLVAAAPGNLQAQELLARSAIASGQPELAKAVLQKAVNVDPRQPLLQAQLGGLLVDLGEVDSGLTHLEAALALAPKSPQLADALFLAALKTGSPDHAAKELDIIRQDQGDSPEVQNLDGLLKLSRLDLAGAQAEFQATVKANPNFLPARINLARALFSAGDIGGYEQTLRDILAKDPASEPALNMLANWFVQQGHQDQALALLETAHKARPKNGPLTVALGNLYIRAGQAQKALNLIAPVAPNGVVGPQFLGLQAAAQLALKQTDQAKTTLNQILAQQPRNIAARRELVSLLIDSKDYEAARNVLQAGMAAMSNTYQFKLDFALIDLKAKGLQAALGTADQLYQEDRADADTPALKGDILMAAGQPAEAAKAYQQAATTPSRLLVLRRAGALQRANQPDAAEKTLLDWLSSHADDTLVMNTLAGLQLEQHQYAAAQAELQALLAKSPRDPAALNNLAWVDQQLNDPAAETLAKQAYILDPTPQTADTLGWILTSKGDASQGSYLLRQATAGSNDPRILYHYAVALKDTGDKAQALKLLQNVAAAQGDFEEKTDARHLISEMSNKGL